MHHLRIALVAGLCTASALAQPAGFQSYAGMVATMNTAANTYPGICQLVDLNAKYGTPLTPGGNSHYAVRISDNELVLLDANSGVYKLDAERRFQMATDIDSLLTQSTSGCGFTDIAALGADTYAMTSLNDGFLLDLRDNSLRQHFCYPTGTLWLANGSDLYQYDLVHDDLLFNQSLERFRVSEVMGMVFHGDDLMVIDNTTHELVCIPAALL